VRHHVYIAYQPPGVFRATATSSLRSAAQPRGDLATSGPYSASKYGDPKAPLAESTEDLPHPSLRRPEKRNATPPLFTASPEIRLNFLLKLPKKLIAALPAARTPLKRLGRLPSRRGYTKWTQARQS
jgi:hypothetical protein